MALSRLGTRIVYNQRVPDPPARMAERGGQDYKFFSNGSARRIVRMKRNLLMAGPRMGRLCWLPI